MADGDDDKTGGSGDDKNNGVTIEAFNELKDEVERLRGHNEKLLGEKKKEADKRRAAEEEARLAEEEAQRKKGDYEALYNSSQQENESLKEQISKLHKSNQERDINSAASRLAHDLADNIDNGAQNATLLTSVFRNRLKFTEDGIRVVDKSGGLTVHSLDDLKAEIKADPSYASLLRGSQASGGGSTGAGKGGAASSEDNPFAKKTLNLTKQAQMMRDNPKKAAEMKAAAQAESA